MDKLGSFSVGTIKWEDTGREYEVCTEEEIDLSNFYAPIGLQTGGDSPEEVAISIAGEILTIYYKKDKINCHMRDK